VKTMQHTDIDPALGLMAEFGKVTKGTVRHINQMLQEAIFADGAVPARYKALAATLWAVSARCEPSNSMCNRPFGSARTKPNSANSSLSPPQWAAVSARCGL
jgi:hypothetical protein